MEESNLRSLNPTALVTSGLGQGSGPAAEGVIVHRSPAAHPRVLERIAPMSPHLPREVESSEPQANLGGDDSSPGAQVGESLDDLRLPTPRSEVLQQWEGIVADDAPYGDQFTAVVRDLACPENPEEQVELSIDEVSPSDRPLMAKGAVFYWAIAYETSPEGQIKRVSILRFRRLPPWTRRDLQTARERAHGWMVAFGAEAASQETVA